jgi:hypothetical protein
MAVKVQFPMIREEEEEEEDGGRRRWSLWV